MKKAAILDSKTKKRKTKVLGTFRKNKLSFGFLRIKKMSIPSKVMKVKS